MTTRQRTFARGLRQQATSAEASLWRELRGRRLAGFKFRRQVPLGPYVVDFLCLDLRLIIEIDGVQHEREADYDAKRTGDLESQGFEVIRFSNAQVRDRLDDVLAAIASGLRPT